jgi:uncharacterized protein YggE
MAAPPCCGACANGLAATGSIKSMKKYLFVLLAATAALIVPARANDLPFPRVSVYGTATTQITPDEMIWKLQVETRGPLLSAVAADHAKNVRKVIEFLRASEVATNSLQTSNMRFSDNWEFKSSERVRNGYVAATEVSFKTTHFDRYALLWLGLAELPDVSIQSVTYDHTKRIQFQNETRDKAIQAAREKAAASAKALGASLGDPVLLEEDQVGDGWLPLYNNISENRITALNAARDENGDALALGRISIRIRVHAAFQLLPGK